MAQFMLGSSNTNTVSAGEPDEFDAGTAGARRVEDESCLPSNGCQLDRTCCWAPGASRGPLLVRAGAAIAGAEGRLGRHLVCVTGGGGDGGPALSGYQAGQVAAYRPRRAGRDVRQVEIGDRGADFLLELVPHPVQLAPHPAELTR